MKEVVGLIIIENGKMLLTLSDNKVWTPPGGKVDEGESHSRCAEREALEEINSRITLGQLFLRFKIETPTSRTKMMCHCYDAVLLDRPKQGHEIKKIIWSERPEDLELSDGTRFLVMKLRAAKKL